MGACASRPNFIETAEHSKENIRVNDAFFPIVGLVRYEKAGCFLFHQHPNVRYDLPKRDFIEQQLENPPQLLIEVRKGQNFKAEKPLAAVVKLWPSGKVFRSQVSSSLLPRWYFLASRTYGPADELDVAAEVQVEERAVTVATVKLDLNALKNQYVQKWFSMSSVYGPAPIVELRVWNLVDPASFWNVQSENYRSAIAVVLSSLH